MSNLNKWDRRFFDLAKNVSTWSKDPNSKVGTVIISPCKKHITFGFNGFPTGTPDDARLSGEEKNELIVHAELNAILNAQVNLKGWSMYCNKPPCVSCALVIIQAGISKVVMPTVDGDLQSKWYRQQVLAISLFKEAGVTVIEEGTCN